jgi:hypothetical protein
VETIARERRDLGFDLTRPPWPLHAAVTSGEPLPMAVVLADLAPVSALRFALECEIAHDVINGLLRFEPDATQ